MGAKDEWPYLLSISIAQEKMIRKYLKQKNISINTFVRVPDEYYTLILDILDTCGGERKGIKHTREASLTSSCNSLTVEGIVFKHVQGFNDVLKLADRHHSVEERHTKNRKHKRLNYHFNVDDNRLIPADDTSQTGYKETSQDDKMHNHKKEVSNAYDNRNDNTESAWSVECKKVQSAYDIHRHLEPSGAQPLACTVDNSGDETEDVIDDDSDNLSDVTIDIVLHDQQSQPLLTSKTDMKTCKTKTSGNHSSYREESLQVYSTRDEDSKLQSAYEIERSMVLSAYEIHTHSSRAQRNKNTQKRNKIKSFLERKTMYKCSECGKVMASEVFYNKHMKLKHSHDAAEKRAARRKKSQDRQSMHVCHVCQKQFSDKYCLQKHITKFHSNSKETFQCDLCGAIMKFKGNLVAHMKSVHTNKRPHRCYICGKSFKILQQMKNHARRHDPSYIETCSICGKTVKKGQISGHMKRHSDNRPHKCDSCDKSFHEKQDLERHLRIHRGEKPYKCPQCNYVTAVQGNLTKHLKHVKHKLPVDRNTSLPLAPIPQNLYAVHGDEVVRIGGEVPVQCTGTSPPLLTTVQGQPPVYVMSRDVITHHEHLANKLTVLDNPSMYRDFNTEPITTMDKPEPKLEMLKNMETIESVNAITNESDTRQPYSSVDKFSYQVPAKMIMSDHVPISVSHVELTKLSPSVHVTSDHSSELTPGYNQETVIYETGKREGELAYSEDQRQYRETMTVVGEDGTQYRDHYLSYMMPAVPDPRYPYTSQY